MSQNTTHMSARCPGILQMTALFSASRTCSGMQEQAAAEVKEFGSGLDNLGNTCYMNACLQCMYAVPELAEALRLASSDGLNGKLAGNARALFAEMAKGHTIAPWQFLTTLRQLVPQFNQMSSQMAKSSVNPLEQTRLHSQQDAEECWGAVRLSWGLSGDKGWKGIYRMS
jgi:ubiquitin carboxyl-terminal hydrolase 14